MLKTLIIATVLLPTLAFAQQQLPQPRRPGEWCPVGWSASGNYCVPLPIRHRKPSPKKDGARRACARAPAIASGKASGGLQTFDSR